MGIPRFCPPLHLLQLPLSFVDENKAFDASEGYRIIHANRIARRLEKCKEYVAGGEVWKGYRCGFVPWCHCSKSLGLKTQIINTIVLFDQSALVRNQGVPGLETVYSDCHFSQCYSAFGIYRARPVPCTSVPVH